MTKMTSIFFGIFAAQFPQIFRRESGFSRMPGAEER